MRRRPSLVTIVGVPASLLGLVGNLATGTIELPAGWKPWIWLAVGALLVSVTVIEARTAGTDPDPRPPQRGAALAEAAEQLADAVGVLWHREEDQRRIHDPFPLAISWQLTDEGFMDHWANIRRSSPGTDPGPLPLANRLDQILTVFLSIPSRRLVVLGPAGSGKTILTLRFVLDMLASRQPTDPVPVVFTLGSWDPSTMTLETWLTHQLVQNHPGLAVPAAVPGMPGNRVPNLAAALVAANRILPVLDGFDEIADGLHHRALTALNATTTPLLLTSRPEEYESAVAASGVLRSAAVVTLDELTVTDLADYLPRTTRKTVGDAAQPTAWGPVFHWLAAHPTDPHAATLTSALATPLMVALARTIYSDTPGHDPVTLLDSARFHTPESLRNHFFVAFVPAVYQRPGVARSSAGHRYRHWKLDQVQRWLTHLASHLDLLGTRDLAWWQLGSTLSRGARLWAYGLLGGAIFAIIAGIVAGATFALAFGLVGGLAFSLAVEGRRPPPPGAPKRGPTRNVLLGLGYGLATAIGFGIAGGTMISRTYGLVAAPVFLVVFGLAYGLALNGPDPSSAQVRVRSSERNVLRGVLFGLAHGLAVGVLGGLTHGLLLGLAVGLSVGLAVGLALGLAGEQAEPSRTQLRLRGRLREVLRGLVLWLTVGLAVGIVVRFVLGLLFALAFGREAGLSAGLLVGIAVGLAIVLVFGFGEFTTPIDVRTMVNPLRLLASDRRNTIVQLLLFGLVFALTIGYLGGLTIGLLGGLLGGILGGLLGNAWGRWLILARFWLPLTGRLPWRTITFLNDAYHRGVLRQSGAVYQFRHGQIQHHLAVAGEHPDGSVRRRAREAAG
ncbi:NACHT domain-containing protein [Micromonospora sp. NPDC003197]